MREAERTFHLKGLPSPDRNGRPHGRSRTRSTSSTRHPKHTCPRRKDELLQHIAECEAQGYRSIKMLQQLSSRGWTCDIRWKEGRAAGITWVHSSGARIRGSKIGLSIPWLRSVGGIPGLRTGRLLPSNWVPRPIKPNRNTFRAASPSPRTLGSSWWDRLAMWAWQLVAASPQDAEAPLRPSPFPHPVRQPAAEVGKPLTATSSPRRRR
jgi:hypothetical protein